ncbi:MAG: hypothetical protein K9N35_02290 [Candidatus Marinimicrobia bacterium]|nr:hypothetical protein [Candidatus Neomarinimicrobiota bacterium]
MKKIFFLYLPYGAIDLLLTAAIIMELINKRYDLLWSNFPILVWGMVSFNKKMKANAHDLVP